LENLDEAVARLLAGELSAFQSIVEATSGALVRLSARMLGNLADAEDVVQDSYMKAYRSLIEGHFDGRSRVDTWLRRIVVNGTIDAMRTRARMPRLTDDAPDLKVDDLASAESRLALRELSDWLDALPPDQRAAVVLKCIEGHSSAEVAELLGSSEGAIEQRLVRARVTLRERRRDT
jgi:RNA polymerase sigma-70 factor (ECF subfamily)